MRKKEELGFARGSFVPDGKKLLREVEGGRLRRRCDRKGWRVGGETGPEEKV